MKIKAIVWMGLMGEQWRSMLLFAQGSMHEGIGPMQQQPLPIWTGTLGEFYAEHGRDASEIEPDLLESTPVWLYRFGSPDDECSEVLVAELEVQS